MGLPNGPVVKNPPSNAGDVGTKIPHAVGQWSSCVATRKAWAPQQEAPMPQTRESPCTTAKTQDSQTYLKKKISY